ncbi:hypothetical protein K491DRAFT_718997 [Lophiostoma macrostomum CBS 122681]|uniref:Uncharacterized protein n=1 Tax=Lophiostoma macrostomum CBS 122681 TaxID=1314788 RepID=A0A6A6T1J9_9PLEO|nr:hypothetical protein K491DRAFT_718997 [Lophiostoma macrostomum CBS 122681]
MPQPQSSSQMNDSSANSKDHANSEKKGDSTSDAIPSRLKHSKSEEIGLPGLTTRQWVDVGPPATPIRHTSDNNKKYGSNASSSNTEEYSSSDTIGKSDGTSDGGKSDSDTLSAGTVRRSDAGGSDSETVTGSGKSTLSTLSRPLSLKQLNSFYRDSDGGQRVVRGYEEQRIEKEEEAEKEDQDESGDEEDPFAQSYRQRGRRGAIGGWVDDGIERE